MAACKDEIFYFGTLITIKVEDTLFQVPRKQLEEQSEVFKCMFTLPAGEDFEADGRNDEQPLFLEGISVADFRSFLTLLFPRLAQGSDESLSEKDQEACLRLAKMWCFHELRDAVIDKLDTFGLTSSRKLELARIHDIRRWYRPELEKLALCSSALTPSNIAQIGPELSLMVYRLKEMKLEVILQSGFHSQTKTKTVSGWSIENYNKSRIDIEFRVLLNSFAETHGWDD